MPADEPDVLVTRRADGTLEIAAWNLVDPPQKGTPRTFKFTVRGVSPNASVRIRRADDDHGNTLARYQKMGSPTYPTRAQVQELNDVAA